MAGEAVERPAEARRVASEPPFTNRGVRLGADGAKSAKKAVKPGDCDEGQFDWYQATIPASPESIQGAFIEAFEGSFEACQPINGYERGVAHSVLRFAIYWGGRNPHPNIKATSHHAQRIAPWVREVFPQHKVSRADIAFDFSFPGAFDELTARIEPISKKARTSSRFVGDLAENDPDYPEEKRGGRTWYFGSTQSDQMVIVYEKGFEMRSKGLPNVDPHLVRVEVRVRPQKQRKQVAATLSPFAMVGFSKWISRAIGGILADTPVVLPNYDKMEKHPLASLEHMAHQYQGHIRAFLDGEDRGGEKRSWSDLSLFLYRHVYSVKERQKMEAESNREND